LCSKWVSHTVEYTVDIKILLVHSLSHSKLSTSSKFYFPLVLLNCLRKSIRYPLGCSESIFGTSDIPCERGFNANIIGLVTFYIVLWIMFIIVTYLNIAMRQRLVSQESESTDVKWITTQALLYGIAFVVTWTPSTMWFVFPLFGYFRFWLDFLPGVLEPIQGLWSLLIFIRNRPESIDRIQRLFLCRNNDFLAKLISVSHSSTTSIMKDTEGSVTTTLKNADGDRIALSKTAASNELIECR
jgi:hypothetical protein